MYDVTLQQIGTFLTVAEQLNFTTAAKALFISQPALSKTINRLEDGLNMKLFVRGNRGVELTKEGGYLYSELRPLFNKTCKAIQNAQNIYSTQTKVLRLGCHTPYELDRTFPTFKSAVREYENRYPDIAVIVELFEFRELRQALIFADVDAVLSSTVYFEDIQNISQKRVENLNVYVAMSSHHPLALRDSLQIEELKNEDFYAVESEDLLTKSSLIRKQCNQLGFTPKKIKYLPNFSSVMMAVKQGKGMTFCGNYKTDGSGTEIKYFPVSTLEDQYYAALLWRTDDISKEVRDFINILPEI
jgi:DNA-binding transcriptional LysR family regulator